MLASATSTARAGGAGCPVERCDEPRESPRSGRSPWPGRSRKTGQKKRNPSTRPTFVAPMLPEPTVRMSIPLSHERDQDSRTGSRRSGRRPGRPERESKIDAQRRCPFALAGSGPGVGPTGRRAVRALQGLLGVDLVEPSGSPRNSARRATKISLAVA